MDKQLYSLMSPLRDIEEFNVGDRVFYELRRKQYMNGGYGDNWIHNGMFIEVMDPEKMIIKDPLMKLKEYLEHHNFMIIKNNVPNNLLF